MANEGARLTALGKFLSILLIVGLIVAGAIIVARKSRQSGTVWNSGCRGPANRGSRSLGSHYGQGIQVCPGRSPAGRQRRQPV